MKKKGLLIFTFFMLILNTVCFLYVDYAMQARYEYLCFTGRSL